MASTLPPARHVRRAFHEELHPARQSAVIAWLAFGTTFAVVRAITYSIRSGRGPLHDISPKGLHLHHYLWGILLVTGVGGVALRGDERARRHPLVGTAYGAGSALIVDEFALLLDLRDVYWAREGRWSVDLGVGIIALAGALLEGAPVLRRLRRELAGRRRARSVDAVAGPGGDQEGEECSGSDSTCGSHPRRR